MIWDEFGCDIQKAELRAPESPLFVGLECEIEDITDHGIANGLGWNVTQDGSLRNNGHEYISKALKVADAANMFQALHGSIKTGTNDPFSQRTSIHVHANCANLTQKHTRDIVWLYALFEEAFFLMCKPDRRDNIHCTPLTETYLPNIYGAGLSNMVSRWHKYTALNLKPLTKQGTIEFRHMHGHNDTVLLNEWLLIIRNLVAAAKEKPLDSTLLDESNVREYYGKIFGLSRLHDKYDLVRSMMNNQIIDLKLAVI
jgi:hypothetical protein